MNDFKFFLFVLLTLGLVACKGKKGNTGLTGPGSTLTTYTGTVPSQTAIFGTLRFTIDVAALTADSWLDVRVTTNSINWEEATVDSLDLNLKQILVDTTTDYISGTYKVLLRNPS